MNDFADWEGHMMAGWQKSIRKSLQKLFVETISGFTKIIRNTAWRMKAGKA